MSSLDVLLPVYGSAPFLDYTLDSLCKVRNEYDLLFIILDRPSIKAKEKVLNFAKSNRAVHVLISEKSGIANALNCGLYASQAQYVGRIDADDIVEKGRFQMQKKFLGKKPEVVAVGSNIFLIDGKGSLVGTQKYPKSDKLIKKTLMYRNSFAHPSMTFNRVLALQVGGYSDAMVGCEDYDLWIRLSQSGEMKNLRQKLVYYRISSSQFSKETDGVRKLFLEGLSRASFCLSRFEETTRNDNLINLSIAQLEEIVWEIANRVGTFSAIKRARLVLSQLMNEVIRGKVQASTLREYRKTGFLVIGTVILLDIPILAPEVLKGIRRLLSRLYRRVLA